jgi:hypothetical protein
MRGRGEILVRPEGDGAEVLEGLDFGGGEGAIVDAHVGPGDLLSRESTHLSTFLTGSESARRPRQPQ